MKNQFTIKRLINGCIVFALGLMTLLTLLIPLLKINDPLIDKIISQSLLDIKTYESGFTLLDFESSAGMDSEMAIICGIFALLQLLLSIPAMIFSVICIFTFNKTTAAKILRGFAISCLVFIGLYMIWGIVFGGIYKYLNIYEDGSWGLSDSIGSYRFFYGTKTYTLAYIGFIIGALLFTAYIVCTLILKDVARPTTQSDTTTDIGGQITKTEPVNATQQNSNNLTQASDIAEALKQYKSLLDNGIITQEEFEKKKQEILG